MNYYNEIDDYAATWIENLILDGLVPDGKVDRRSIVDICAADLVGFTQCHFFAGIAGWPLALQLAGWPADREIWTGSCPCQPFSQAGRKGDGLEDERHLWPYFFDLIRERRPPTVVGEQVASKDAEPWLDLVWSDLESVDFAFAALAFPSASVGAPHIRDRTYWMGHANDARLEGHSRRHQAESGQRQATVRPTAPASELVRLADSDRVRRQPESGKELQADAQRHVKSRGAPGGDGPGPINGFWRDADWLAGRDGKWRPVEPGSFPLAARVPSTMGRLRAYGNAINPEQGAEFLRAAMECLP